MPINWDNVEFKNEKRFLSNMYPCLIKMDKKLQEKYPMFVFDDEIYGSSEHLYQALKSESFDYRESIRNIQEPTKTKTAARKLKTVDDAGFFEPFLREDWESVKDFAMKLVIELKFSQNKDLAEKLIDTGNDYIEERNDWNDLYWGTHLGVGQNKLGIILMDFRDSLHQSLTV